MTPVVMSSMNKPAEARKPGKWLFCVVVGEKVTGVEDETMNPQNLEELSGFPRRAQLPLTLLSKPTGCTSRLA